MEQGLVQDPPAHGPGAPPAPALGSRDTRGAHLGGISQFSLEALTRTTGAADGKEAGRA